MTIANELAKKANGATIGQLRIHKMRLLVSFTIGFTLMLFLLIQQDIFNKAWSTELKIPKLHKAQPAELCLPDTPGMMYGSSTQIVVSDTTCKSGQRWRNKK